MSIENSLRELIFELDESDRMKLYSRLAKRHELMRKYLCAMLKEAQGHPEEFL